MWTWTNRHPHTLKYTSCVILNYPLCLYDARHIFHIRIFSLVYVRLMPSLLWWQENKAASRLMISMRRGFPAWCKHLQRHRGSWTWFGWKHPASSQREMSQCWLGTSSNFVIGVTLIIILMHSWNRPFAGALEQMTDDSQIVAKYWFLWSFSAIEP